MLVRGATGSDVEEILAFLEHRGSARVARRGELVDATPIPRWSPRSMVWSAGC